ncbi:MAG: recombinase family protein [Defluviitaleaceae bacterium]|nr:recombinase family protein [Defluviitaleaceae bacterium]
MKTVAIYVRVSTDEQANSGYSIGEQKERLLAYCKAKDWIVQDLYIDAGYSGSNLERPAIQKLQEDIGKFNIVLVYKLDRLSRSQYDILALIEKKFLPNGVDFVSMSESFDTSTPFGRAMIGILGVFAQLEREQIKERVTMGRNARARAGKYHGGGKPPIGYDYDGEKLIINQYEAEQIRLIFQMAADYKSNEQMLKALNAAGYTTRYGKWSSSSRMSLTLRNNVYIGVLKFGDIVYENAHEPIISHELFEKANKIREVKLDKYGKNIFNRTTLLSGLIWCAKCGARYSTTNSKIQANGKRNRFHSCYSRSFPKSHMAKKKGCTARIWRVEDLENLIESEIKKITMDKTFFSQTDFSQTDKAKIHDSSAGVKKGIEDLDKQLAKLMDLYALDKMPLEMISQKVNEIHTKKTALLSQAENIHYETPAEHSFSEFKSLLDSIENIWKHASNNEKRMLLSSLINKILIDDGEIIIEWTFDGKTSVDTPVKENKAICPACGENNTKKDGKLSDGRQRYCCKNKDCTRVNFTLD